MARVGKTTIGGSTGTYATDYKYVRKVTFPEAGLLSRIEVYTAIPGASSQTFRALLYAADGPSGGPGTLLNGSGAVTVAAGSAAGWKSVALPIFVIVTAGQEMWIGIHCSTTSNAMTKYFDTLAGAHRQAPNNYVAGATNPFGTPDGAQSDDISMAITYIPDPAIQGLWSGYTDFSTIDSVGTSQANRKWVQPITFPIDCIVSRFFMALDNIAVTTLGLRGIVYDDDGVVATEPGTLLSSTAEVTLPALMDSRWVEFVLPTPLNLMAGTYWFGQHYSSLVASNIRGWLRTSGGVGRKTQTTDVYTGGTDSFWTGAVNTSGATALIYVPYTSVLSPILTVV